MIHVVSFDAPRQPVTPDVYAYAPYVNTQGVAPVATITRGPGVSDDLPYALLTSGVSHGNYPDEHGQFGTPEVGISQRFSVTIRRDSNQDVARIGIVQFFRFMACDYYFAGLNPNDGSLFAQAVPTAEQRTVATDTAAEHTQGWYDMGDACFLEITPRPVAVIPPQQFSFSDTPRLPVPLWLYNPRHNNAANLLRHAWVKYDFTTVLLLQQLRQPLQSICYFDWTVEWVYDFTPPVNYLNAPTATWSPTRTAGAGPGKQATEVRTGAPPHPILQPYFRSPGAMLPPRHPSAFRTNPVLVDVR